MDWKLIMATVNSTGDIIARGTPNAAFAQLATTVATTRSGTLATLSLASTTGLSNGDYVLIQGHDLEEYNGVFQIVTVTTNTSITYTMKADPGASSTSTVMTVDKVLFGNAVDMSIAYDGKVIGGIQNGNTTLGAAAQIWVGESVASSSIVDYVWRPVAAGDAVAKSWTPFSYTLRPGTWVNFVVCRNTTGPVDVRLAYTKTTAV